MFEIRFSDEQERLLHEFVLGATEAEVEQGVEPGGCEICITLGNEAYGHSARVSVGDHHLGLGEVDIFSDH